MHFSSADYCAKEYKVLYRVHHLTCTIHSIVKLTLQAQRIIVKLAAVQAEHFQYISCEKKKQNLQIGLHIRHFQH
jgi:hypothetical protein